MYGGTAKPMTIQATVQAARKQPCEFAAGEETGSPDGDPEAHEGAECGAPRTRMVRITLVPV